MRVLLLSLCVAGCFTPSIQDGGFVCAAGGACPQGFSCIQDHCWSDYGPGPDVVIPVPDAGTDLVSLPEVGPTLRRLGETCDPVNAGTTQRHDNCGPGLVCIDGDSQSVCFQRCTGDAECGQARCEERSAERGAVPARVCGLPPVTCTPGDATSCPARRVCYLSETRTVCEISSGDNTRMACTYSRECLPGYVCATGIGAGYCQRACSIVDVCPSGTTCQLVAGTLGYCY